MSPQARSARQRASRIRLLAELPADEQQRIIGYLRRRTYPAKTLICPQQATPARLIIVASGTAGLMYSTETGDTCMIRAVHAGDVADATSLIRKTPFPGYLKACTDVVSFEIPALQLHALCDRLPRLRQALLDSVVNDAARTTLELREQRLPEAVGRRLLRAILRHTRADGWVPFNQTDLGALVGASRQHVNHALVPYIARGLIETAPHKQMRVLDREGLARAAGLSTPTPIPEKGPPSSCPRTPST